MVIMHGPGLNLPTGTSKKNFEYGEKVHFFLVTYFKEWNFNIF